MSLEISVSLFQLVRHVTDTVQSLKHIGDFDLQSGLGVIYCV